MGLTKFFDIVATIALLFSSGHPLSLLLGEVQLARFSTSIVAASGVVGVEEFLEFLGTDPQAFVGIREDLIDGYDLRRLDVLAELEAQAQSQG